MSDVYLLKDGNETDAFYVGESFRPEVRITEHIVDTNCNIEKALRLYRTAEEGGQWHLHLFASTPGKKTGTALEACMCYLLQDYVTNSIHSPTPIMDNLAGFDITEAGFLLLCSLKDRWQRDSVYCNVLKNIRNIIDDTVHSATVRREKLDWSQYKRINNQVNELLATDSYLAFLSS